MAKEVQLVELVKGDSTALVDPGSRAEEHFLGLGYRPAKDEAEPAPPKKRGRPKKADF